MGRIRNILLAFALVGFSFPILPLRASACTTEIQAASQHHCCESTCTCAEGRCECSVQSRVPGPAPLPQHQAAGLATGWQEAGSLVPSAAVHPAACLGSLASSVTTGAVSDAASLLGRRPPPLAPLLI